MNMMLARWDCWTIDMFTFHSEHIRPGKLSGVIGNLSYITRNVYFYSKTLDSHYSFNDACWLPKNSHVGIASTIHPNSLLNLVLLDNLNGIMRYIFSGQPITGIARLHNFTKLIECFPWDHASHEHDDPSIPGFCIHGENWACVLRVSPQAFCKLS